MKKENFNWEKLKEGRGKGGVSSSSKAVDGGELKKTPRLREG